MARLPVHKLKTNAKALNLGSAKVYHLPKWHTLSHPERLKVIRQIAMMRGRDPRIAQLAVDIIKKSGVRPRQYAQQAAAILSWVQDPENIYYVNEPGERLQDPIYTIKQGHADCDDQVLVLCALFESVGLPWKLVLSGRNGAGRKIRHIEDQAVDPLARWSHIYCMVGDKPFRPSVWYFAEPTVEGVPLGWDVVSGDHSFLPEMAKPTRGPAQIAASPQNHQGYRAPLPSRGGMSPAYQEALGSLIPVAVASSVADEKTTHWTKHPIVTGVVIAVGTTLLLEWVKGEGMWKGEGTAFSRLIKKPFEYLGSTSSFVPPFLRD